MQVIKLEGKKNDKKINVCVIIKNESALLLMPVIKNNKQYKNVSVQFTSSAYVPIYSFHSRPVYRK